MKDWTEGDHRSVWGWKNEIIISKFINISVAELAFDFLPNSFLDDSTKLLKINKIKKRKIRRIAQQQRRNYKQITKLDFTTFIIQTY